MQCDWLTVQQHHHHRESNKKDMGIQRGDDFYRRQNFNIEGYLFNQVAILPKTIRSIHQTLRKEKPDNNTGYQKQNKGHPAGGSRLQANIKHKPIHRNGYRWLNKRPHNSQK